MGNYPENPEDILDMSDEDFMSLAEPEDTVEVSDSPETAVEADTEVTDEVDADTAVIDEVASEGANTAPETEGEDEPEVAVVEGDEPEKEVTMAEQDAIDYKAEYEALMAPFKANGIEMTPKSVADAQRLMQQGANYHKKMAGMKPALKALKTLENNGLLDDGKLDFLIDLNNGNQDAITTLLKQKQIDPRDVDIEAETTYTPGNHQASDKQIELDSVLNDIEGTGSYNKTLNVVTKGWDEVSRKEAISNPQIISIINEQMETGIYDQVMGAVEYSRSVGELKGVSDFDAYKYMGNKMETEGHFKSAVTPVKDTVAAKPKVDIDPVKESKRLAQKKSASPTANGSKTNAMPADFNPLEMSDEEFAKFDPKLIGIK